MGGGKHIRAAAVKGGRRPSRSDLRLTVASTAADLLVKNSSLDTNRPIQVTDWAMETRYHPAPWHEWPPAGGSQGKPHRTPKILSHARRRGGGSVAARRARAAGGTASCWFPAGYLAR